MIGFGYYLLKVIVCSGILFFYYHLFLRNKLFHQWNRFYLLAAVGLSMTLPLLRFDLEESSPLASQDALNYLLLFQSTDHYLDEFVIEYNPGLTTGEWLAIAYATVSASFCIALAFSLSKVIRILRRYPPNCFANIKLLSTREAGSPFSFLHYIIWNEEISLHSSTGQQIFQHELVHVRQKHTWDKLFMQVVLVFLWCNPFFWFIRKELRLIHEFIADQEAVGSDTEAFAAMVLQSVYPNQFTSIVNPFFQSSIKRRLFMLTQVKNPRVAYLSRIIALPLVAMIAFTICVRTNAQTPNKKQVSSPSKIDSTFHRSKQIKNVDVLKDGNSVEVHYNDGRVETMSRQEANKKGIITDGGYGNFSTPNAPLNKEGTIRLNKSENPPLYIIDGKEATQQEMQALDPKNIERIDVLKGESAKATFGEKGKNGVVEIKLKKQADSSSETKPSGNSASVPESLRNEPLYLLDGKEASKEQVSALNPNDIKAINVFKEESAVPVFGEKGKNGVIQIEMKKNISNEPITAIGKPLRKDKETDKVNDNEVNGQPTGEIVVKGYKKDRQSQDEVVVMGYPTKSEIVFEKAEFGASIDPDSWRQFLEKYSRPVIEEVAKTAPSGKYTVLVKFVVEKDGSLSGVQIVDDPGFGMGQKVAEMMKHAPKWKPAIQNERVVRSYHTQPITFVIHGQTITKK